MNETLNWVWTGLAGLAGLGIGGMFFGGLWWTVRQGVNSKRPALLFAGSMLARIGLALAGFYFVSGHRWERSVACLAGFIAARMAVRMMVERAVERLTRPASERGVAPAQEAGNAA